MSTVQAWIDELDDHGFDDIDPIRKLALINDTVYDVCSRVPWPFLETVIDLTFDGSSPTPTNWPADFRAALMVVDSTSGARLQWIRLDDFYRQHGGEITATNASIYTSLFYFVGKQMRVWPVPSSTTVLHMPYVRLHPTLLQTDLETAILIPKQHHRVVVLGALYKLYDLNDDFDLAPRFQTEYEARIQTMSNELWVPQYAQPDMVYDTDILQELDL